MSTAAPTKPLPVSLLLASMVPLMFAGCRSSLPTADLGGLYNRAAQHVDDARNPVIVIPGILGSKLVHPDSGRTVWGAFGGGAVSPRNAEDARIIALPMAEGTPLRELRDDVVPDGVLEKLKVRVVGLPLELRAYYQVLQVLGVGGYRDEDFHFAGIDYGTDHFSCFQFDYDWRRDNVENARLLHRFILEKKAYVEGELRKRGSADPDVKFDVIAHSMGGLILRYFLRYGSADLPADGSLPELDWSGAGLIEKAVVIAPPNAGAADTLVHLLRGRKFGLFTPRYDAALIGTFPALYQLLPRVRHRVLVEDGEPVDFLDPAVWEERGWGLLAPDQAEELARLLPGVAGADERRRIAADHLRKNLARARHLHAALDRPAPLPEGTGLYLIAGDAVDTVSELGFASDELEVTDYAPGDGTVLRSSALMDERVAGEWTPQVVTPIDWTQVTFLFTDHLGMTRDPVFTDNVLYLLLEAPSGPRAAH